MEGRRVLNTKQYKVVSKVANRVVDEMKAVSKGTKEAFADIGEPLRWCVHGGPGTGKSHIIKILRDELFGELLQWNMSVEFQIVAFQAVMADLLGGDTVHHALNIGIFDKCFKSREGSNEKKSLDVMKSVLQLRWLIIDEISMVSARLLADIDLKLRSYYNTVDPFALDANGDLRPFAGLNILMSGDFWQLPPTGGGCLCDVPYEYISNSRQYAPAPSISHGQSLVWSELKEGTGVQGVTELTECERTKDVWLKSVQDEFRVGRLTADTHAFLHGEPTLVPGSTINGKSTCKTTWCRKRATEMFTKQCGSISERCSSSRNLHERMSFLYRRKEKANSSCKNNIGQ